MFKVLIPIFLVFSNIAHAATIAIGDDWSVPTWVTPSSNYVYFNEISSPAFHINNHVIDVTWRQINPAQGVYSQTNTDSWTEIVAGGETFNFDSFADQRALAGHYWLRIWLSGEQWVPQWVLTACNIPITQRWVDHSQQDRHIPLWNACIWNHAKTMYQKVFVDWGVKDDPKFEFAYVPGGFFYSEFDFDVMWSAFQQGAVTSNQLLTWLQDIRTSLVSILAEQHGKLMYTGQDYPFDFSGEPYGDFELHARDAVNAGMGVRNGISELFNFHLNETPAYGSHIEADGHVSIDESFVVHKNNHVIGNENECFNACGFSTDDTYYAVVMANLKALQLRSTHLLVETEDSFMAVYANHWNWVEHELAKKVHNAADAWVALREYEDRFFVDAAPVNNVNWSGKPWLHNFERWLLQKDQAPDGQTRRGTDVRTNVLDADNGTSYEGRRTNRASNQDYMYFFIQDDFAFAHSPFMQLKVSYMDTGNTQWQLQYRNSNGQLITEAVTNSNSNALKTATFTFDNAVFDNGMTGNADFRIYNGGVNDIEIRFVRLIRMRNPIIFADGFE
jgi:hypothetical protein